MSIDNKIKEGLEAFERNNGILEDQMEDLAKKEQELLNQHSVESGNSSNKYIIGALLLALILVGAYFLFNPKKALSGDSEKLYYAYFEMLPPIEDNITRGEIEIPEKTLLEQGNVYYQNGQFAEAMSAWNEWKVMQNRDGELDVYLALLHLENDELDQAISLLKTVQSGLYYEVAQWYLALAHLKNNDFIVCEGLLHQIIENSDHYKNAAAKKLLADLK